MRRRLGLRRMLAVPIGAILMVAGSGATAVSGMPRDEATRPDRAAVGSGSEPRPRQAANRSRRTAAATPTPTRGGGGPFERRGRPGAPVATTPAGTAPPVTSATSPPRGSTSTTTTTTTTTAPREHDGDDEASAPPAVTDHAGGHEDAAAPATEPAPRHSSAPRSSHDGREDSEPVPETAAAEAEPAPAAVDPAATGANTAAAPRQHEDAGLTGAFTALPPEPTAQPIETAGAIADAFTDPQRRRGADGPTTLVTAASLAPPPRREDVVVASALAEALRTAPAAQPVAAGASLAQLFDAFVPAL
ncbi:MAG: hypothetical protein K1X95_10905 [Acidimicrobiia bacterium]|nr:hypothetical protein [Acidimicrobiia bacterium]